MSDTLKDKNTGVILPVTATASGAYLGGLLASHAAGRNLSKKWDKLAEKKEAALLSHEKAWDREYASKGSKLKVSYKDFKSTEKAYNRVATKHLSLLNDEWERELQVHTNADRIGQLRLARLEGYLEAVENGHVSFKVPRQDFIDALKAQIKAVDETIEKVSFSSLTGNAITDELNKVTEAAIAVFPNKVKKTVRSLDKLHLQEVFDALAKAEPQVAEQIANRTSASKIALETAEKRLLTKGAVTETIENGLLAHEKMLLEDVADRAKHLGKMAKLNAESDFLAVVKRPWDILMEGSTRAKAITATSIALGALVAYRVAQSMRVDSPDTGRGA